MNGLKKTPSNYKTGRAYESELKAELEAQGYVVFKPVWVRFSKQMDVFNIFDLLAWHPVKRDMLMYQLTASAENYKFKKRLEKVQGFNIKELKVGCLQKGGKQVIKKFRVVPAGV